MCEEEWCFIVGIQAVDEEAEYESKTDEHGLKFVVCAVAFDVGWPFCLQTVQEVPELRAPEEMTDGEPSGIWEVVCGSRKR